MKRQRIIDRNETLAGPAPKCVQVLRAFPRDRTTLYLNGYYGSKLIPKLSLLFNVPKEQIIASYGAEDFLRFLFDQLDAKRGSVLTSKHHYMFYSSYARFKGIRLHRFAMREHGDAFSFDIDDCIAQYRRFRPNIILIASPNNPTGNMLKRSDLKRLLSAVSSTTLVLIDEAYLGFQEPSQRQNFLPLVRKHPNLVLLRSFSKLAALAGLRIGYALCGSDVLRMIRYQQRYLGMSRVLEEVAIAALESPSYYRTVASETIRVRSSFISRIRRLHYFKPYASQANFVLMKVGRRAKKLFAAALAREPVVIAKSMTPQFVRVSMVSRSHVSRFASMLERIDRRLARQK